MDEVRLNPIYKWFQLTEDEYLEKDILNPAHPYYEEYMDVLKDERLKSEKIFWWGGSNIHDKRMLPGTEYRLLYVLMSKWLILQKKSPNAFSGYCQENGYKNILIYGFANWGHRLYEELKEFALLRRLPIGIAGNGTEYGRLIRKAVTGIAMILS